MPCNGFDQRDDCTEGKKKGSKQKEEGFGNQKDEAGDNVENKGRLI